MNAAETPCLRFSALWLPHSGNVCFFLNGQDIGFMRWEDKSLWVTAGTVHPDLQRVAAAYVAAHAFPENETAIEVLP